MKPDIFIAISLLEDFHAELAEDFTIHYVKDIGDRVAFLERDGARILGIVTNGTTGADAPLIAAMPNLQIIASFSAGYEKVDVDAARQRGIAVTHGPGVNAPSTADHAMGLVLACLRGVVTRDRMMRGGEWQGARRLAPTATGKNLGIVGLGTVGAAIARRAEGFDMGIAYHNRRRRADVAYDYMDSVAALAAWADILVASCPGGPETRHLIDADVLARLGPRGYLVNISRGSVVDTAALIKVLRSGAIAGAGLDVFEDEPKIADALLALDNVVLSPHVAGFTNEAFRAGVDLLKENLKAHFSGKALITPAPYG